MAIDKQSYELLAAYLTGNISSADRTSVEKWIMESEENQRVFQDLQKLWNNSGLRLHYTDPDSAQLLIDLKKRLSEQQRSTGKVVSVPLYKLYLRVAAGICLLMVSYFVIRWATRENMTIDSGNQVATVYLPDSTKVWLNVNSQITYPRKFVRRRVELNGEAFLSVREDTTDFTVTTKHTVTRVSGTAFNVKEEADSSVTLTVAEGSVNFSSRELVKEGSVIVKAQQKAVFKPQTKVQMSKNNDPSFAMWREQNNPLFEEEKRSPHVFLANEYTWRKNQINQSVIEGNLTNSASLAAYNKVKLEVTYTKPDGEQVTVELTITDTVYPGKRLSYRRRLLDILTDTRSIAVKIKSAEVTSINSY